MNNAAAILITIRNDGEKEATVPEVNISCLQESYSEESYSGIAANGGIEDRTHARGAYFSDDKIPAGETYKIYDCATFYVEDEPVTVKIFARGLLGTAPDPLEITIDPNE